MKSILDIYVLTNSLCIVMAVALLLFCACSTDKNREAVVGDGDMDAFDIEEAEYNEKEAMESEDERPDLEEETDCTDTDEEKYEENSDREWDSEQSEWSCTPATELTLEPCVNNVCPGEDYCLRRDDSDLGLCMPDCTPHIDCPCNLCGEGCPPGKDCSCLDSEICSWESYEGYPTCKRKCSGYSASDHTQCALDEICIYNYHPEQDTTEGISYCIHESVERMCPEGYFLGGVALWKRTCFPGGDGSECMENCQAGYACENGLCIPQCPEWCSEGYCTYETAPGCAYLECNPGSCTGVMFPPTGPRAYCCGRYRCCKAGGEESDGNEWGWCKPADLCESGEFLDPY